MASIRLSPPLVIAAGAIWPPICAAVVALRFVARRNQHVPLGIDDWLVLPALALVIGIAAAILRGAALRSVGYPTPPAKSVELAMTTSSHEQTVTRQVFWVTELMQVLALSCVKLSCMFFYRRVFRFGSTKIFDTFMILAVVIIVAWAISFFFAFIFACGIHFDYLWTSLANEAKCVKTSMLQNGFAISDVITDFMVLIFPIPLVWRLNMSNARKFGLTGIFVLGALAVAASITRMVIYVQATAVEFSSTPPDEDLLSSAAIYTMIIEAGFGLCAANLPILYGMVRTKGVHKLIDSFLSLFSFKGSLQDSHYVSSSKRQISGSQDSGHPVILNTNEPRQNSSDIELAMVEHDDRIHVTRMFQWADETV